MKKNKVTLSVLGVGAAALLAGCFGEEKELAPASNDNVGTENVTVSDTKKKLTLEDEELKIYIEEIKAQRYSAMQSFQAFFPAVYLSEIRTSEYQSAIENIVAQYQYVFNAAEQLAHSYPDNEDLIEYNQIVKFEATQVIVPMLKPFYHLTGGELLDFDKNLASIPKENIKAFNEEILPEVSELLSADRTEEAYSAKALLFDKQKELLGEVGKKYQTTEQTDAEIDDLVKQLESMSAEGTTDGTNGEVGALSSVPPNQ